MEKKMGKGSALRGGWEQKRGTQIGTDRTEEEGRDKSKKSEGREQWRRSGRRNTSDRRNIYCTCRQTKGKGKKDRGP